MIEDPIAPPSPELVANPPPGVTPPGVRAIVSPYCRTRQQLEGTAAFLRWLCTTREAAATTSGVVRVHRSIPQLTRGMGLPNGPTVYETHQRWRNQVYRWAGYLAPVGVTVREAPPGADGRGTGLIFTIPAGVAQSVKAAVRGFHRMTRTYRLPRHPGPGPGCEGFRVPFSWKQVSLPPNGGPRALSSSVSRSLRSTGPAGARAGPRGRPSTAVHAPAGPAPAPAGPALTDRRPTAAARDAADLCAELTGHPWTLSWATQTKIERYVTSIDRLQGRPDTGRRWLLDAIEDTFQGDCSRPVLGYNPTTKAGPRDGGMPRTMAYFARLLRHRRRYLSKYYGPRP